MSRTLPPTASVAERMEDGRLYAASAANNTGPISAVLRDIAPREGRALELASGTGQHVIAFARTCPGLIWVPTDVDDTRLASIGTYVTEAQLGNLSLPMRLDATTAGWSQTTGPVDLIVLSNLLHLISEAEAQTLVREAAQALAAGGKFVIYGPFMRAGELTSDGDARFHAELTASDPEIGYKDDFDVIDWAGQAGLDIAHLLEMPANNLCLVLSKPIE